MKFRGSIVLETERLILRPFQSGDEVDMFKNYCNDPRVCEYVTWKPHGNIEVTTMLLNSWIERYSEKLTYKWAIVLKETNEVIGAIDVVNYKTEKCVATLGYVLGHAYWGQGIMPEAGKKVIDYLFDEGFIRIDAWHNVENPKSGRVMQKIGMTHEGTLRKYDMNLNGELCDMEIYSIIKN